MDGEEHDRGFQNYMEDGIILKRLTTYVVSEITEPCIIIGNVLTTTALSNTYLAYKKRKRKRKQKTENRKGQISMCQTLEIKGG